MPNFVSPNYPSNKFIIQKPILPRIDWKNSITQGLVFDSLFSDYPNTLTYDTIKQTQGILTGTQWVGTPYGIGLDFGSVSTDVLTFSTDASVNNLTSFSSECWIYVRTIGGGSLGRVYQKLAGANTYWMLFILTTQELRFQANFATTPMFAGFTLPAFNGWLHVVTTCTDVTNTTAANVTMYFNAVSQTAANTQNGVGTSLADDTNLYIGNRSDGIRNFDGQLAYLRVWNRVLSQQGVSSLYNSPFQIYQQYQNSFLHTIGRMNKGPIPVGTIVSETEQETSQIIIDKVFQGQKAAVALSTVTLTFDVNIPSPDAVLVVTGGSVIATGAQWADINFNGTKLTNLVQAIQTGADAEIWYLPYPPVGVGQLTITSGTGGEIYANAMVILGVDKRSTNITTASATDAASTSTIGALITPDAPNSLIIDTLSTLNATTFPTQDASQTQVFNATALVGNEYVLSTYKLASAQQNMNYNLSVAVNASLVVASFRPANAASMWFPNIDFRQLDDVVTVAGLDAEVNPSFGQYGYKESNFFLNSFLHTVGRKGFSAAATQLTSTLLMMGVS